MKNVIGFVSWIVVQLEALERSLHQQILTYSILSGNSTVPWARHASRFLDGAFDSIKIREIRSCMESVGELYVWEWESEFWNLMKWEWRMVIRSVSWIVVQKLSSSACISKSWLTPFFVENRPYFEPRPALSEGKKQSRYVDHLLLSLVVSCGKPLTHANLTTRQHAFVALLFW